MKLSSASAVDFQKNSTVLDGVVSLAKAKAHGRLNKIKFLIKSNSNFN